MANWREFLRPSIDKILFTFAIVFLAIISALIFDPTRFSLHSPPRPPLHPNQEFFRVYFWFPLSIFLSLPLLSFPLSGLPAIVLLSLLFAISLLAAFYWYLLASFSSLLLRRSLTILKGHFSTKALGLVLSSFLLTAVAVSYGSFSFAASTGPYCPEPQRLRTQYNASLKTYVFLRD